MRQNAARLLAATLRFATAGFAGNGFACGGCLRRLFCSYAAVCYIFGAISRIQKNVRVREVGTGTEDIINKCREYGLKTPEFYQEEDFRVVIWRVKEEDDPRRSNDDPKPFQSVPTNEERLLEMIRENPSISRAILSKQLNMSERQVRKIIDRLRENCVLTREGGNSGKWIIHKI